MKEISRNFFENHQFYANFVQKLIFKKIFIITELKFNEKIIGDHTNDSLHLSLYAKSFYIYITQIILHF